MLREYRSWLSLVLGLLALRLTINASIIAPPLNSERTESITFTPHPTPAYNPDLAVFGRPKPVFATVAKENPPVLYVVNSVLDTAALRFESFFDSNCGSEDALNHSMLGLGTTRQSQPTRETQV